MSDLLISDSPAPPPVRVRLCAVSELPLWGGRLFRDVDAHDRDVLVFRVEGRLVAFDAACPHAGALLRPENELGGVLTCYLHQWRFRVADGGSLDIPGCALTRYPVEIDEEGSVLVTLPDEPGPWAARRAPRRPPRAEP